MKILSGARPGLLLFVLTMFGLLSSCSRDKDDVSPTSGTITATLPSAAALRYTENVVATAADGKTYTVVPDATTGEFSFTNLPPGAYVLTFTMRPASFFPKSVPVTVVAGEVARPKLPNLTSDGRFRGTMTWKFEGKTYSTTELTGQYSNTNPSWGPFFYMSGYYPSAAGVQTGRLEMMIPGHDRQGKVFAGVGVYSLGTRDNGPVDSGAYIQYTSSNESGTSFARYATRFLGRPLGSITITRFDEQAGVVVGSFEAAMIPVASMGMGAANNKMVTVTDGSFDVTF